MDSAIWGTLIVSAAARQRVRDVRSEAGVPCSNRDEWKRARRVRVTAAPLKDAHCENDNDKK